MKEVSVSDLVGSIKSGLEKEYRNIAVTGEISNLSRAASGHWYFSIKDKDSLLQIALFKNNALKSPIIKNLKEGDQVLCFGDISVYPARGSFQLIAKQVLPRGKGTIEQSIEKLKKELQAEGLFDLSTKKKIPLFSRRVAIVTAGGGAAVQDFLKILKRRNSPIEVIIADSLVQGKQAVISIMNALDQILTLNKKYPIDLVVLARGGGSLEDLMAFNDENLVRAVADYEIPIISAIGHEVDYLLTDYSADLRAETPSAAAELISKEYFSYTTRIESIGKELRYCVTTKLNEYLNKKERISQSLVRLKDSDFRELKMKNDYLYESLDRAVKTRVRDYSQRLLPIESLLNAFSPHATLKRGFCYTTDKNGKVVSSLVDFSKYKSDDSLNLNFHDGKVVVNKQGGE